MIITIAHVTDALLSQKIFMIRFAVFVFLTILLYENIRIFSMPKEPGLRQIRPSVVGDIERGRIFPFSEKDPKSYLYYLYGERPKRAKK